MLIWLAIIYRVVFNICGNKYMHNRYEVIGIHCKECVNKISNALSKVGKYSLAPIREDNTSIGLNISNNHANNWFKDYYPLLLIIGFIVMIATFISFENNHFLIYSWMNTFMSSFFIIFSFFKLLDIKGFVERY